jgi:hypothetical protein
MRSGARPLAFALAGLIALAAGPSAPLAQSRSGGPEKIRVAAAPIAAFSRNEPERRRFGVLEFRGGLVLSSEAERFGGLSGLSIEPDGENFLALSDRGHWLRGRIAVDGDRPTGIADAEIAPVLGANGRPLAAAGWYDTEALARDRGTLYVGIERVHRLVSFDFGGDGLAARARALATPAGIRGLPGNQGIEGLVFVPKPFPLGGTLIAFSERGLDADRNIRGFLIGGPSPGTFSVKRSNEFDITDAALTNDGNLLILERHFSFLRGVGMRIRRVPLAQVKPGALLDGTVLIEAGNSHQIDNMEALAVHRNAAGETILTILSDDNLSKLQRTLLLRFALVDE